jgi:hypothetical protein
VSTPRKDIAAPGGEILLYQTEDGRTRIECRFENETLWLTQPQMAELFQVTPPTVNGHLKRIYTEGELDPERTIRKFRMVRPAMHVMGYTSHKSIFMDMCDENDT